MGPVIELKEVLGVIFELSEWNWDCWVLILMTIFQTGVEWIYISRQCYFLFELFYKMYVGIQTRIYFCPQIRYSKFIAYYVNSWNVRYSCNMYLQDKKPFKYHSYSLNSIIKNMMSFWTMYFADFEKTSFLCSPRKLCSSHGKWSPYLW